jgi:hypothetical protein
LGPKEPVAKATAPPVILITATEEAGDTRAEIPHAIPAAANEMVGAAPEEFATVAAVEESTAAISSGLAFGATADPSVGSPVLDAAATTQDVNVMLIEELPHPAA